MFGIFLQTNVSSAILVKNNQPWSQPHICVFLRLFGDPIESKPCLWCTIYMFFLSNWECVDATHPPFPKLYIYKLFNFIQHIFIYILHASNARIFFDRRFCNYNYRSQMNTKLYIIMITECLVNWALFCHIVFFYYL